MYRLMLAVDHFWLQVVEFSGLTIKRIKTENRAFELIEGAILSGKKTTAATFH